MLKIGIIGSGFGLYGLLPAFYSIKNCSIVAVCANNQERLSKYCYSLGLKNTYSDWRAMLEKENLDALAIAVTPNAQYNIAKTAIQKGIHVFAEKPLADTYEHAKILYNSVVKHNITHAVDFIFPEIDEWIKVKKMLDEKKFGKLAHISVNWNFLSYDIKNNIASWKTDTQEGGGALSFYFSHSLYYIEYFTGEIEHIKSSFSYSEKSLNGAETGVDLLLRFKNGITGAAHISCDTIGLNRHQLIFRCEKATIILENRDSFVRNFELTIYTDPLSSPSFPRPVLSKVEGKRESSSVKKIFKNNHINPVIENDTKVRVGLVKKIAKRFISACVHNQQMAPSMKEGLRVQQLIEIIKAQNS